jgi:hypothetical protein
MKYREMSGFFIVSPAFVVVAPHFANTLTLFHLRGVRFTLSLLGHLQLAARRSIVTLCWSLLLLLSFKIKPGIFSPTLLLNYLTNLDRPLLSHFIQVFVDVLRFACIWGSEVDSN